MWRRALKRIPKDWHVKSVLLIGSDDRDVRRAIGRRWKKAEVVTRGPKEPGESKGSVDLIVILDWEGREAGEFAEEIAKVVDRYGYVIVPREAIQLGAELFKRLSRQPVGRFQTRQVVVFRPRGAGTEGDALPDGFMIYHASKAHQERECRQAKRFQLVGSETAWGTRWNYGPCWFEKYWGDTEPEVDPSGPLRMVIWQPLTRRDTPKGWFKTSLTSHFKMTGFETIAPGAYDANWSSHARRHLNRWRKERDQWELFEPTPEEFNAAYRNAKLDPVLKYLFIDLVKDKTRTMPEGVRLFALRRKAPGSPIEAGFGCIDIPEIKTSKHFVSFIVESAKKDPVGVGLMDEWHKYALSRGFTYLDFGVFWAPGDPGEWRGFSQFKSQFNIHFIRYPDPLVRFTGSVAGWFRRSQKTPA